MSIMSSDFLNFVPLPKALAPESLFSFLSVINTFPLPPLISLNSPFGTYLGFFILFGLFAGPTKIVINS